MRVRDSIGRWLLLSLATACGARDEPSSVGRLDLHLCLAPATHAVARCGHISLPENRDRPNGRQVHLAVLVLPATDTQSKLEPIVFLHGGPGRPASRADDYVSYALGPSRARHDLVMVDMRGTGGDDALTCELYQSRGPVASGLEPMFPVERVRECATRLSTRADLAQYTSENAARDLDAVRNALHVEKWSLFGASYGTRLAFVYMRMFPSRVERVALLGVLPPEVATGRDFARGERQALDSAFADCARDDACRRDVPDPRRDVATLVDRLGRQPATVTVGSEHVVVTKRAALEGLFIAAYNPSALVRLLPLVHRAVVTSDMRELAEKFAELSHGRRYQGAVGVALSVWCSEDVPRMTSSDTVMGDSPIIVGAIAEACRAWPHAPMPVGYGERVISSIPTLLMSGARDPATPAYLADSAAIGLSRAERYVDPAAGHAALDDRARDRMAAFFANADSARRR